MFTKATHDSIGESRGDEKAAAGVSEGRRIRGVSPVVTYHSSYGG